MLLEKEIEIRVKNCAELITQTITQNQDKLIKASQKIAQALKKGNKVLLFGNGGSAAEAQHFAAEFVNRMVMERKPLPAIALTTDSSILTSVGNDRSFEEIFAQQIKALGKKGDIAIGISTSGESPNVLRGLEQAGRMGIYRIGLAGRTEGQIGNYSELCFWVDSKSTPRIQEVHLLLGHLLVEMVDLILFGKRSDGQKK